MFPLCIYEHMLEKVAQNPDQKLSTYRAQDDIKIRRDNPKTYDNCN